MFFLIAWFLVHLINPYLLNEVLDKRMKLESSNKIATKAITAAIDFENENDNVNRIKLTKIESKKQVTIISIFKNYKYDFFEKPKKSDVQCHF